MGTMVWQLVQLFSTKSRPFPAGKIASMLTLADAFVGSLAVASASGTFAGSADPREEDGVEHRVSKHMLRPVAIRRRNRLMLFFLPGALQTRATLWTLCLDTA